MPTTTDGGTREGGGGGSKNELRGDVRERNDEDVGNEDGGAEPKPATNEEGTVRLSLRRRIDRNNLGPFQSRA